MFRLFNSGARIIVFALMGLAVFVVNYPIVAACIVVPLVLLYLYGRQIQRSRMLTLDLRTMSPIEYEHHCVELLRAAGWNVQHVGRMGDQGVDVIANLRGTIAAIQCKKYTRAAGNDAVQQVVAGRRHYGASIAVVACPSGFTRAAHQLAQSNAVLLMSHADLSTLEQVARVP